MPLTGVAIRGDRGDQGRPWRSGAPAGRPPAERSAAQRRDARTWTFTLDGAPPRLTVRTFDADGGPLGEAPVTPPWQRVGGGTEECGPQAAEVAFSGG